VRQIESSGFNASEAPVREEVSTLDRASERFGEVAQRLGQSFQGTSSRAPLTSQQLRRAGLYALTPEQFQGNRLPASGARVTALVGVGQPTRGGG